MPDRKKLRLRRVEVGRVRGDTVPPQLTDASPGKSLEIDVIRAVSVIKRNSQ